MKTRKGNKSKSSVLGFLLFMASLSMGMPKHGLGATIFDSLHSAAWDMAIDNAAHRSQYAFAFYAYRTLAVPHPEVYLLADLQVSQYIEELKGSRNAYRNTNPRDIEFYRRIQNGEETGQPFKWRHWTPVADSIYDDPQSSISWLDRRLPSCAVLLRSVSSRLSTVEAAGMRYTASRRDGDPADSLFVIVDTEGHGYLLRNSILLSPSTGQPSSIDPKGLSLVLAFNESHVYYPLMGRDDRQASAPLSHAVASCGLADEPVLTPSDQKRLDQLTSLAALPDIHAQRLAILLASGMTGAPREDILEHLHAVFDDGHAEPDHLGFIPGMTRSVLVCANMLSLNAAGMASTVMHHSAFADAVHDLESEYLDAAGRRVKPDNPEDSTRAAWGYLWSFEFLDIGLDDIIRTRAGRGSSQAIAMSAILSLADVKTLRIELDGGLTGSVPEQHWLLTLDGRWQFNVGQWKEVPAPTGSMSRFAAVVRSLAEGPDWVDFARSDEHCDWAAADVAQSLARLEAAMPTAIVSIPQPLHDVPEEPDAHGHPPATETLVPLAEYARRLVDDEIHWDPIPWPAIGLIAASGNHLRN